MAEVSSPVDAGDTPAVLDVVVVGAGPHALALLARLLDDRPNTQASFEAGALPNPVGFREGIQELFHKPRCNGVAAKAMLERVAVIDPAGRWLSQWDKAFSALQILQLRSTVEMHPCIFDAFAMQSFARKYHLDTTDMGLFAAERTRSNSKTMFANPSSDMFFEFCTHLVDLYGLRDVVRPDRVTKLTPQASGLTSVSLQSGACLLARHVVVATGPTSVPRVPNWADGLWRPTWAPTATGEDLDAVDAPEGAMAHAWELITQSRAGGVPLDGAPVPRVRAKADAKWSASLDVNPRLLVVGGGLTAVHLFRRAVDDHGCQHVHLLSRAHEFHVKQFDVNMEWVSYKKRPRMMGRFCGEKCPTKRLEMLMTARGRGSITPEARVMLDATLEAAAARAGTPDACDVRVEMGATIEAATWLSAEEADSDTGEWEVYVGDGSTRRYDIIWLATGSNVNVREDPLLGDLLKQQPIDVVGGLPVLEPTLRWRPGCEVYVMGPFAALSLGPDALNLTGSRTGACRIGSVLRPELRAVPGAGCGGRAGLAPVAASPVPVSAPRSASTA